MQDPLSNSIKLFLVMLAPANDDYDKKLINIHKKNYCKIVPISTKKKNLGAKCTLL